ncbi:Transmembrane protease serine 13 [Bulinus truncatus]|nr:Transmembrane protease serine 13 [Bulinus truncatus]
MIDALWVLTAAHCVKVKDKFYTVYFGCKYSDFSDFILFRTPILIILHDEFNSQSNSNDIALLKLDFPVAFTSKIRPACLPVDGQEFSMNDRCYITGYGERYKPGPSVLQQLKVYVVPDREYTYLWKLTSGNINWRYIGVGRVRQTGGSCFGDSGGPLSCEIGDRYYVAGMASVVPPKCSSKIVPDAYIPCGTMEYSMKPYIYNGADAPEKFLGLGKLDIFGNPYECIRSEIGEQLLGMRATKPATQYYRNPISQSQRTARVSKTCPACLSYPPHGVKCFANLSGSYAFASNIRHSLNSGHNVSL